jgi:hypothetical protein
MLLVAAVVKKIVEMVMISGAALAALAVVVWVDSMAPMDKLDLIMVLAAVAVVKLVVETKEVLVQQASLCYDMKLEQQ